MSYKVIWSAFSEKQIDSIFNYYSKKANPIIASKIVKQILLAPEMLIKNPKIGQQEIHLTNRFIKYHYILALNYKIIYSVDEAKKRIKIADVFDTRQDPKKIEREK